MRECREWIIGKEESGQRVDKFLSEAVAEFSRERLKEIFEEGNVMVDGKPTKPSLRLKSGDAVSALLPETEILRVEAQDIPLHIVYQDQDIAIIDKAQGMVVHPAPGASDGTMVNALMYHMDHLSAINGVIRPGIVHRIDKNTSGLLVVAKNDTAHRKLAAQFAEHSITRAYSTVVHGVLPNQKGTVDAPIGRDPHNRKAMAVTERNNKRAVTHYSVIAKYQEYTHLDVRLETGRTHQIRVHMKYIGHPVIGDPLYGRNTELDRGFDGQLLHAYLLGFRHPSSGEYIEFRSELPQYFYRLIAKS